MAKKAKNNNFKDFYDVVAPAAKFFSKFC